MKAGPIAEARQRLPAEAADADSATNDTAARRQIDWLEWLPWFTTPALLIAFVAVWDFYTRSGAVSALILPPPAAVAQALVEFVQDPRIHWHVAVTMTEIVGGFTLALIAGVGLGVLLGKVDWLERTFRPFIVGMQVIPKVALIPLFIIWFGFGIQSKIITAAILAFFPIITNTLLGIRSVDRNHRDVLRTMRASRWQTFRHLELPSALPAILTGMQIAIVMAMIGAVVGEYLGGNVGLGYLAVATLNAFDIKGMFAVVVLLASIGLVLYSMIAMLRKLLIPWHISVSKY